MVRYWDNSKRAWVTWTNAAFAATIVAACATPGASNNGQKNKATEKPGRVASGIDPDDCDWKPTVNGLWVCDKGEEDAAN